MTHFWRVEFVALAACRGPTTGRDDGGALESGHQSVALRFGSHAGGRERGSSRRARCGGRVERAHSSHLSGVDLDRFRPGPPPAGRFRLLFASTPADPQEFHERGIPLMVEAARRCPDVGFCVAVAPMGDAHTTNRALALLQPPSNFRVEHRDLSNMAEAYDSSHATVCLFDRGFGKSCPNSVIEGLACGRPALVSEGCGIAGLVAREGAGVAVRRDPAEVALAIERLRRDYDGSPNEHVRFRRGQFDLRRFVLTYRELL